LMRVVHDMVTGIMAATKGVLGVKMLTITVGVRYRNWAQMRFLGRPRDLRVTQSMVPDTSIHLAMMNMTATVMTPVLEKPAQAAADNNQQMEAIVTVIIMMAGTTQLRNRTRSTQAGTCSTDGRACKA
jgi:hypothetical protein